MVVFQFVSDHFLQTFLFHFFAQGVVLKTNVERTFRAEERDERTSAMLFRMRVNASRRLILLFSNVSNLVKTLSICRQNVRDETRKVVSAYSRDDVADGVFHSIDTSNENGEFIVSDPIGIVSVVRLCTATGVVRLRCAAVRRLFRQMSRKEQRFRFSLSFDRSSLTERRANRSGL